MSQWRLDYSLLEASAKGRQASVRLRATHNAVTALGAGLILGNLWVAALWYAAGMSAIIFDVRMGQRFLTATPEQRRARGACFFGSSIFSASLYSSMALALAIFGGVEGRLAAAFMTMSTFIGLMTHLAETSALMLVMAAPSAIVLTSVPLLPGIETANHPALATIGLLLIFGTFVSYLLRSGANTVAMIKRLKDAHAESEVRREEAETRRKEAEAADRAKSEFLANMSHELRTPLNAVIGYAEILQEDLDATGDARMAGDALRIQTQGRHLLGLIDNVLDLSNIDSGRMALDLAEADIAALVRAAAEKHRAALTAKNVALTIQINPSIGVARTDSAKLKQCLDHLLENAAKFTHQGNVTVSVDRRREGARTRLVIAVADTGIGMSADVVAALFRAFGQGDSSATRKFGGLGLGLAVTRKMLALIGGDISATSTAGEGSTFIISLPLDVEPDTLDHAEEKGPCDVLVIDDDPAARELVRRAGARVSLTVYGATRGAEGLARALSAAPSVIVLDIGLPDMDGWTVLRRLRETPAHQHTPVIVLTAIAERAQAMEAGAAFYLKKPAERDELIAALARFARPRAEAPYANRRSDSGAAPAPQTGRR
ncbi:MAG: ATP-binding protein [Hyphomonadaceae bacterium]